MTAQQLFTAMVRDLITPGLHELGMQGSDRRGFRYTRGGYAGLLATQKSRHNSKDTVAFTVNVGAVYLPTGEGYWQERLGFLMPGWRDTWWTLHTGDHAGPVAGQVLAAIRDYGWPAILAALDSPGFPPDPTHRWARSFPPEAEPAPGQDRFPAWDEEPFAGVTGYPARARVTAVSSIVDSALDDPRALPTLVGCLASDPDARVRLIAARGLARWAARPDVAGELRASADQDEDLRVRWAARYALRLASG